MKPLEHNSPPSREPYSAIAARSESAISPKCPSCNGEGSVSVEGHGGSFDVRVDCPVCNAAQPQPQAQEARARKDDTGKARYDLIPPGPLHELAVLYATGAKKYADRNWELGLSWGRVFSAMMRHAWAWWRGEERDPVDGQHHLDSVAWCAFALREYVLRGTGSDDRSVPSADKPLKCA